MSNISNSNLLKYKVKKNIDGSLDFPKVFLMSRNIRKRGQIYPIEGLKVTPKFNESNECSFTVYKDNNGVTLPLFDRIKDNCIIKIEGYGLYQIKVSLHETDAIYKEVTGTEMQACELSQCNCTLEINTEDDIARGDYDKNYPTVFYRTDGHTEASLLHRILTYAPTYSIGYVDPSLRGINRKFSCSNSTVYDFLQDVASEIGCIFVFTPDKREINIFDAEDHCTNPKCSGSRYVVNGVCQKCHSSEYIEHGYGLDASTFLGTENLLEEITDTIDADSIKNCFKLVAGDDETTNLIGQRLIGGSPYIWTFSDFEMDEFSDELREKWKSYQPFVDKYQTEFNTSWDTYNDCVNQKLYWMSGKMPVVENPTVDTSNPMQSCKNIYDDITSKITYTAISSKKAVESTVASQVLNYAKLLCPEGYEVSYQVDDKGNKRHSVVKNSDRIITSFTSYIYICLKNCKDKQDSSKDKYFYKSGAWTIPVKNGYDFINKNGTFTTDYFLYMKQQLDYAYAKLDITYQPKYDTDYDDGVAGHLSDPDYYKNYFREYGIQRLTSFKEAYDQCTVSLLELNSGMTEGSEDTERKYIKLNGVQSAVSLYEELSGKYIAFSAYISEVIAEYTKIYDEYESKRLTAKAKIDEINTTCNLKTYLGDELYHELLTFKREGTYENKNYSSDVVDEATLMGNIEEFLIAAKNQIAKACQPQHEVTVKMAQLLTLSDYETVFDAFAIGNYVRSRVNGEVVKMRVISIPIDFENIEQSDVTFSDTLVGNNQVKSMQEQFQKAASLATSFDFVEKQSERNDQKVSSMSKLIDDGLDATKNMIMNSENQDVVMDTHGILGRELDLNTNTYMPEQYRLANKGLIFTDNNWDTIRTALGKIYYNGAWTYGLIADTIVGRLIAGENLEIGDKDGNVSISSKGAVFDGGAITWKTPVKQSAVDGLENDLKNINDNIDKNAQEFADAIQKAQSDLQSQIDGEIDSWFEAYDPTPANEPASKWSTDDDKIKHEGDLFYNTATGGAFRYIYDSATKQHKWSIITDTTVAKALADAAKAQDTADGKRRVFTTTPTPPYDIGDLWAQGANGDLYKCKTSKSEGKTYSDSDWEKATKYTNDDALHNFVNGDYKDTLADIGTQIDGKADTFYQSTKPHDEYTNIADNATCNLYVGDLWYDTTSGKSYRYTKTANGSNFNYSWQFMNVPNELYDTIDGIASIYTTIPSQPNIGDLLIPNSDLKSGSITYYAGKVYKYNGNTWVEIRYTDDTKANEVDSALTAYKQEITDFQKEVDTQLSVAGVTKIASDYVYSPKIASGYLYITKDGCSVQIDPSQSYDAQNDKVIAVNANKQDAFYIKRNGDAYFKGDVAANSLTLNVGTNSDGKNYLNVSKDGLLTARNAIIYGTVYATDGEFSGTLKAAKGEFNGTVKIDGTTDTNGAITIEGNSNLDRMQVHAGNSYTRQDYEKFYSGNDEALSKATNAIYVGQASAAWEDHDTIEMWDGGTYTSAKSMYSLHSNYSTMRSTTSKYKNMLDVFLANDDCYVVFSQQDITSTNGVTNKIKLTPTQLSISDIDNKNTSTLTPTQLSISDGTNTTFSVKKSGNCIINTNNFSVTESGTIRLNNNELVFGSFVLTAGSTVVDVYLPAEKINCTMPVSVCNGDGDAILFDLNTPTILPSKSKVKVTASNLTVGANYRITYSYWKQL